MALVEKKRDSGTITITIITTTIPTNLEDTITITTITTPTTITMEDTATTITATTITTITTITNIIIKDFLQIIIFMTGTTEIHRVLRIILEIIEIGNHTGIPDTTPLTIGQADSWTHKVPDN